MDIHERREAFYKDVRHSLSKRFKDYDERASETYFNLAQAHLLAEGLLSERAQLSGLTLAGLNVLMILQQHGPAGLPLNTLSQFLVVTRANVTGLVDSLARKGLVMRQDHPTDRRVILAKITSKGESLLNAHFAKHSSCLRDMTAGLTGSEKETLIQILTKMRKSLLSRRDAKG